MNGFSSFFYSSSLGLSFSSSILSGAGVVSFSTSISPLLKLALALTLAVVDNVTVSFLDYSFELYGLTGSG